MRYWIVPLIGAMWWFEVWPLDGTLMGRYTYLPEVGYYAGEAQKWYVGDAFSKQEDCASAAVVVYNSYNAQSKGRAFSWACRKMQGDSFLERVR